MSDTPSRNAAGREIWFRPATDAGGVYQPVTGRGCAVMLAGVAWVIVCGTAMMVALAWLRDARALLFGFVPLTAGLVFVARAVKHHS